MFGRRQKMKIRERELATCLIPLSQATRRGQNRTAGGGKGERGRGSAIYSGAVSISGSSKDGAHAENI